MTDILTNENFENLSWHDNAIYSLTFPGIDNTIKLNIDHIIEWVQEKDQMGYKFIVAPAILCFQNITNLSIDLDFEDATEIFIDEIIRENKRLTPNKQLYMWDFIVATDKGILKFTASGFRQYYTNEPKLGKDQKYIH